MTPGCLRVEVTREMQVRHETVTKSAAFLESHPALDQGRQSVWVRSGRRLDLLGSLDAFVVIR
jgi:hypothetical protein